MDQIIRKFYFLPGISYINLGQVFVVFTLDAINSVCDCVYLYDSLILHFGKWWIKSLLQHCWSHDYTGQLIRTSSLPRTGVSFDLLFQGFNVNESYVVFAAGSLLASRRHAKVSFKCWYSVLILLKEPAFTVSGFCSSFVIRIVNCIPGSYCSSSPGVLCLACYLLDEKTDPGNHFDSRSPYRWRYDTDFCVYSFWLINVSN